MPVGFSWYLNKLDFLSQFSFLFLVCDSLVNFWFMNYDFLFCVVDAAFVLDLHLVLVQFGIIDKVCDLVSHCHAFEFLFEFQILLEFSVLLKVLLNLNQSSVLLLVQGATKFVLFLVWFFGHL